MDAAAIAYGAPLTLQVVAPGPVIAEGLAKQDLTGLLEKIGSNS